MTAAKDYALRAVASLANQKGVIEIKGDRKGMGYRRYPQETSFTDFTFSFDDRDTFYLTTDGLIDQIGARVAARSASGVSWTCSRRIAGFPWASRRSPCAARWPNIRVSKSAATILPCWVSCRIPRRCRCSPGN
jgi:hypothetical protein